MSVTSIGQRYIDFLNRLKNNDRKQFDRDVELLFSPTIKKVINSLVVCNSRDELVGQMRHVTDTYDFQEITLLEIIPGADSKISIIRFEVAYADNTAESIIAILKCDDKGLIKEINEVFGDKAAYQWQ